MGPRGRFYPYLCILHILDCLGQDMQVLYLGRAPRTKETLPDFLKWRRVTRPPLVFRGLTCSQRTPGFGGITLTLKPFTFKNSIFKISFSLTVHRSIPLASRRVPVPF